MLEKDVLRQEMRRRLKELSPADLEKASCLTENLKHLVGTLPTRRLFGYMAIGKELSVADFMQSWLDSDKILCLPRFDSASARYEMVAVPTLSGDCILSGKFGIQEPADNLPAVSYSLADARPDEDIWLVPGLAFASNGNRLGRGGGYYDRLLENALGLKLGIAWDCQIVDDIPRLPFDVAMDYLVTPTRIVPCVRA